MAAAHLVCFLLFMVNKYCLVPRKKYQWVNVINVMCIIFYLSAFTQIMYEYFPFMKRVKDLVKEDAMHYLMYTC